MHQPHSDASFHYYISVDYGNNAVVHAKLKVQLQLKEHG